jgi:predicted glutamine amidotransferase
MCRLVGWISDEPRSLRDVLGKEALDRFADLSGVHGHGWGTARLDPENGRLTTHHSISAARDDPDFPAVADIRSRVGLFHLRWATPGFDQNLANTHPFVRQGRAMIHNGAIGPAERLPLLRRPGSGYSAVGSTDSEQLFLALLDEVDHTSSAPGDVATAIETISDRAVAGGLSAASLNSLFIGRFGMTALNWHDPANVPAIDADDPSSPPYYDLRHRHGDGLDVVASSGFVSDPQTWALLPNASLLTIDFGGGRTLLPVRPSRPLCPLPASAWPEAG